MPREQREGNPMSSTLADLIEKHWYEVTLDQIKVGDRVAVIYGYKSPLCPTEYRATPLRIIAWKNDETPNRYFVPEPPAPAYEPGTVARITEEYCDTSNAVRTPGGWTGHSGAALPFLFTDDQVEHVEVIAFPDGSRPIPEVTDEDVQEALVAASQHDVDIRGMRPSNPIGQGYRAALESFVARKFGGQA